MICMVAPEVKDRVLAVIREQSPRPTELLDLLQNELSYREVQDALSELLDDGVIVLTSDRHLLVRQAAA